MFEHGVFHQTFFDDEGGFCVRHNDGGKREGFKGAHVVGDENTRAGGGDIVHACYLEIDAHGFKGFDNLTTAFPPFLLCINALLSLPA